MSRNTRSDSKPPHTECLRPINGRAVELVNRFMRRPAEQLYDVAADPYQMKNLIGDLDLASTRERLAAELGRWMQSQGDPGASLNTEPMWRAAREGEHLPTNDQR